MHGLSFARTVALGALVAGLMVGAVAVRADELAVQNHPDQALQRKLDQLDHGSDTSDTPPSTGVNDGSFPRSMRIPGTDTSIHVYGSATEILKYSR